MDEKKAAQSAIDSAEKMIVCAQICMADGETQAVLVQRGMIICTTDGEEAGKVAAVLVNGRTQQPTHLILRHLVPEYRLVPIYHIKEIYGSSIELTLLHDQLGQLPLHEAKP